MANEFKLPELGENIESIQVVRVMVAVGGTVAVDQPVLELETDKATIEVPSTVAGTVTVVHVQPGERIKRGQLIFSLAAAAAKAAGAKAAPAAAVAAAVAAAAPATTPAVEGIESLDSVEPAKAKAAVPALAAPAPTPSAPLPVVRKVPAAPSVRRFAREIGIALEQVPGSGPHRRVSIDDVKRYAKQLNEARPVAGAVAVGAPVPPLPDFSKWGAIERRKMSVIRTKTAEHMTLSWSQVPHVTIYDKADITELEPLRKRYADLAEREGGKLTLAVMICKIVAQALRKFPIFNATADMATREIIFKQYVHLGIAVNTPRGLMVPVVRDADTKNMVTLAAEIQSLAAKCRDGKIKLEEIEGSTFTITNLGRICGTYFTPIVNYPEVAILGLGRAFEEPAVVDGNIVKRMVLPLSLSFDHRVIDGADGAAFMGWIKEAIEQPLVLALNG
ncbi:MAG TPA: branched-chain alpha-keto acid dehydrogenase subunit E2 [Verrucomicrobia bacterium]|nr:branched-chain alpha-keto acid dehydrogenase subunit E2 [Verrucomicrobiota bacterium]